MLTDIAQQQHCQSAFQKLISGLPQGSALRLMTILIFVSDAELCCGDSHL
jgi:hypothetical protein